MMDDIVNPEVQPKLRSDISPEAIDLIKRLLNRDPKTRYGYEEIKAHPFFKAMKWDDLNAKRINPPFKPKVKDEKDVRYIDKEFLRDKVEETPTQGGALAGSKGNLTGFTYDKDMVGIKR